jgi:hypothetical protein
MLFQLHWQESTPDSIDALAERLRRHFRPSVHQPGRHKPVGYAGWVNESGFELTNSRGLGRVTPVTASGTFQGEGDKTVVHVKLQPVKFFYVINAVVIVGWIVFCIWAYLTNFDGIPNRNFVTPVTIVATGVCFILIAWQSLGAWVSLIYVKRKLTNAIHDKHSDAI